MRNGLVRALLLLASGLVLAPVAALSAPPLVTVTKLPARVCASERHPAYLNLDFLVDNPTNLPAELTQVTATVTAPPGKVVERRIAWQQALTLMAASGASVVAPRSRTLMFNPLQFVAAGPGSRIDFAFEFAGQSAPVSVEVRPELCRTRAALQLPLAGRILVLDGHDVLSHHRRFDFLAPWAVEQGLTDNMQRFALDLVAVDEAGNRFRGAGDRNADFYGWGAPVRAPGAGVVVAFHGSQADNDEIGAENRWTDRTWDGASGNYVIIRHDSGEFSSISHLRQGSVRVKIGDTVRAGQIVGEVGNSGSSIMPHVHYQLQTGLGTNGVVGLPAYFRRLRLATGERVPAHGTVLDSGDIAISR